MRYGFQLHYNNIYLLQHLCLMSNKLLLLQIFLVSVLDFGVSGHIWRIPACSWYYQAVSGGTTFRQRTFRKWTLRQDISTM